MELFGPPDVEKLKVKGNVEGLIKALEYEKEWPVRREAAEALGKIKDARAVEPLIKALEDKEYSVCRAAAFALVSIRDARAVEPLIAFFENRYVVLGSSYPPKLKAAVEWLGEIAGPQDIEPLKAALFEPVEVKNPEQAVHALFELALSVTPDSSPENIQTFYDDVKRSWSSQVLAKGSREQIKSTVLANLQRISREQGPGCKYLIEVFLDSGAA